MSLNLHAIVRQAINANYADETFKLYRSVGQKNVGGLSKRITHQQRRFKGIFKAKAIARWIMPT